MVNQKNGKGDTMKSTGIGAVDAALYAYEKRVQDGTEQTGAIKRQYPTIDPNYKLTVEDAILMFTNMAKENPELADMHNQVVDWLKELMSLRNEVDRLREESDRNSRILDMLPWDMVIDAKNAVDEEDEENAEN
jgi:hypothetical protein